MVILDRVSFAYGEKMIFNDFSKTFALGKTFALIGPSGCGKTTLLRLIAGLETPQSGTVTVPKQLKIATMFQENRLLPWLTVRQNVALVLSGANEELVDWCLEALELAEHQEKYPAELSGGMQRRVALARALVYGGDILLLDEPFNGLDEELKMRIALKIKERFAEKTIFLVTHSQSEAALLDGVLTSI